MSFIDKKLKSNLECISYRLFCEVLDLYQCDNWNVTYNEMVDSLIEIIKKDAESWKEDWEEAD